MMEFSGRANFEPDMSLVAARNHAEAAVAFGQRADLGDGKTNSKTTSSVAE